MCPIECHCLGRMKKMLARRHKPVFVASPMKIPTVGYWCENVTVYVLFFICPDYIYTCTHSYTHIHAYKHLYISGHKYLISDEVPPLSVSSISSMFVCL